MRELFTGKNEENQFKKWNSEAIVEVASNLFLEYFPNGAEIAAKRKGVNVIIDTFRASNTILALLKYCNEVFPVSSVEDALNSDADIIVGEVGGLRPKGFHLTNSPVEIEKLGTDLKGKKVVLRTTNGTQGLLKSRGAKEVIVASPRNLGVVVDFLEQMLEEGLNVTIIPMGTSTENGNVRVPEDDITGDLIIQLLKGNEQELTEQMLFQRIFEDRAYYRKKVELIGKDIEYCLQINKSRIIPKFDQISGTIVRLDQ